VNFIKRHVKPNRKNQQGGIVTKEAPIHVSNVMLFSTKLNTVTKPIMTVVGDARVRICKKTGDELNKE
jgi:large subunit ribosomal protein L24